MIELTFNTVFMLYLSLTMALVLGIWIYSHYRMRNRTFFMTERALFICEYCHFAYVEDRMKQLNRCPQCGLFNKKNLYQRQLTSEEKD
jgi:ribosomal protein L37AE/L43A